MANNLYTYKRTYCLSSPEVKYGLNNIHKDFAEVLIDKATRNIALVCKRVYASVIAKELGLNGNSSANTCNKINNLSANDIDKSKRNLRTVSDIDNILIFLYFYCLTCTGCQRSTKPQWD